MEIAKRNEGDLCHEYINLIKAMGYVPYANITEFGDLYFDHVPCFHLKF